MASNHLQFLIGLIDPDNRWLTDCGMDINGPWFMSFGFKSHTVPYIVICMETTVSANKYLLNGNVSADIKMICGNQYDADVILLQYVK